MLTGPAWLAAATVLLHLALSGRYGYEVDELYFLACAEHLDWGYVDHPPMIALVAWLVRATLGTSLPAIRLAPALASGALVLVTGRLARELGGGRFAQGLAALAVAVAPIYLVNGHYLSMNAFEPLFWMGVALVAVRALRTGEARGWPWAGVLAGLGFQNKQTMLLFGLALVAGILVTSRRALLRSRPLLVAGGAAALIALPNAWWQVRHGFPTLEFLLNVRSDGTNVTLGAARFVAELALMLLPLTAPLWLAGLWFLLRAREGAPYRALGVAFLVTLAVLVALGGKVSYLAPACPMLLAAGAVVAERRLEGRRVPAWLRPACVGALLAGGAIAAPFAIPVLSEAHYIAYAHALRVQPPPPTTHPLGLLHEFYANMEGWEEMTTATARAFARLSPAERARAAIFTENYGQAGAIDLLGRAHGLPKAISTHQSYFLWGPRGYSGEIVIVLGKHRREELAPWCGSVEEVARVEHQYAMPDENFPVFLCRGLGAPLSEAWPALKRWR